VDQKLSAAFSTPQIMKSWDHECFLPRRQDRSGLRYQPLAALYSPAELSTGHLSASFSTPRIMGLGDHDVFLARRQARSCFALTDTMPCKSATRWDAGHSPWYGVPTLFLQILQIVVVFSVLNMGV
jgi:hypothetical protein